MARYTRPLDLYKAQTRRFERLAATRQQGFEELERAMLEDAKALTGGTPDGAERLKILEKERPFARLGSLGMRRGGGFGSLPLLPVGMISHDLHDSLTTVKFPKGFGLLAPGINYAKYVLGSVERGDKGTVKMVSRGFQKAINSRFRARFKAWLDYYRREQKRD